MTTSDKSAFELAQTGPVTALAKLIETDLSLLKQKDEDERTLLHWACSANQTAIVAWLLTEHAGKLNIDAEDDSLWTSLHIASSVGNKEVVEQLLKHGASVSKRTETGQTAFHYTASKNHTEVAQALVDHINKDESHGSKVLDEVLNVKDQNGMLPLHRACTKGNIKWVKWLFGVVSEKSRNVMLKSVDRMGNAPLHLAAEGEYWDVVRYLFEEVPTVMAECLDIKNKEGQKPMDLGSDAMKRYLKSVA